eukprot:GHRR01008929.1.p1 GENE.GHRR01008929.1~~GHRR01008929.1.p1  ORF type:complete len:247 (+),score=105.31 GHRR01008929.1:110-850(+)
MSDTQRISAVGLLFALLVSSVQVDAATAPAKGVFESCPACRLDAMPELKKFFHESVLKGEYGDKLTVKFIPGATPELVLYDASDKEISREVVSDKLSYDQLHGWVQGKGFAKAADAADAAATTGAGTTTASTPGPAPVPAEPKAAQQQQTQVSTAPTAQESGVFDGSKDYVASSSEAAVRRRRRMRRRMRLRRGQQAGESQWEATNAAAAGKAAGGGGDGTAAAAGHRRRKRQRGRGDGGDVDSLY